jgi:hypothetical protein
MAFVNSTLGIFNAASASQRVFSAEGATACPAAELVVMVRIAIGIRICFHDIGLIKLHLRK